MKRRRFWKIALLFAVPLALFAYVAERNSWRPKTIVMQCCLNGPVRISPDGHYLAVSNDGKYDKSCVYLFDLAARRVVGAIANAAFPLFIDEHRMAVVYCPAENKGRCTRIYSVPGRQLLASSPQSFVAFSTLPDKRMLLGKMTDEERYIDSAWTIWEWLCKTDNEFNYAWDTHSPKLKFFSVSDGPPDEPTVLTSIAPLFNPTFSPRNSLVAGQNETSESIGVWDNKTGRLIRSIPETDSEGSFLCFSPDCGTLAVANHDGTVKLWRIK